MLIALLCVCLHRHWVLIYECRVLVVGSGCLFLGGGTRLWAHGAHGEQGCSFAAAGCLLWCWVLVGGCWVLILGVGCLFWVLGACWWVLGAC